MQNTRHETSTGEQNRIQCHKDKKRLGRMIEVFSK